MKKVAYTRHLIVLTLGLLLLMVSGYSSGQELTKKEKKEAREAELQANFQILDTLIQNKTFVIVADFLQNQYGDRVIVPNQVNFIKVDSKDAVLQTGNRSGVGGNGVGGNTAEGSIENWKVTKNFKTLSYNVRFSMMSNIGSYDVSMDLSSDTNARATITGMTRGKLIYEGHVETIGNTSIFKGNQTRF
jgi:hypothetical protein